MYTFPITSVATDHDSSLRSRRRTLLQYVHHSQRRHAAEYDHHGTYKGKEMRGRKADLKSKQEHKNQWSVTNAYS